MSDDAILTQEDQNRIVDSIIYLHKEALATGLWVDLETASLTPQPPIINPRRDYGDRTPEDYSSTGENI